MLNTSEHQELIAAFEKLKPGRLDKEDKALWAKGHVYQDGHVNNLFLMFRQGHAHGVCYARVYA